MEYPELTRAVAAEQARFCPAVILIEDKASGTQLIQELVAMGVHAVTRCSLVRRPSPERTGRGEARRKRSPEASRTKPKRRLRSAASRDLPA
jgi:hypothetical protein